MTRALFHVMFLGATSLCSAACGVVESAPEPVGSASSKTGGVSFTNLEGGEGIEHSAVFAHFMETSGESGCVTEELGQCEAIVCDGTTNQRVWQSPGELIVSGTELTVDLKSDYYGQYQEAAFDQYIYAPGAELVVEGDGSGAAPAFSIAAIAPSHATLSAPLGNASLDRSEDLEVTWEADGDHGELSVELGAQYYPVTTHVYCNFPMSDRHGVVPSALLELFSPGVVGFAAFDSGSQRTTVRDWDLVIAANRTASGSNPADLIAY